VNKGSLQVVIVSVEKRMKNWTRIALVLMFVPLVASAQYKDLDAAMSGISRGFERGDTQQILAGVAEDEKVMLQFPGILENSGFFGRDQASYMLDELFSKTKPTRFQQSSARKVSSENQYYVTATWTIQSAGKSQDRDLYVTLRSKADHYSIVSIRSGSR